MIGNVKHQNDTTEGRQTRRGREHLQQREHGKHKGETQGSQGHSGSIIPTELKNQNTRNIKEQTKNYDTKHFKPLGRETMITINQGQSVVK